MANHAAAVLEPSGEGDCPSCANIGPLFGHPRLLPGESVCAECAAEREYAVSYPRELALTYRLRDRR